jgi:hypothetical protein
MMMITTVTTTMMITMMIIKQQQCQDHLLCLVRKINACLSAERLMAQALSSKVTQSKENITP